MSWKCSVKISSLLKRHILLNARSYYFVFRCYQDQNRNKYGEIKQWKRQWNIRSGWIEQTAEPILQVNSMVLVYCECIDYVMTRVFYIPQHIPRKSSMLYCSYPNSLINQKFFDSLWSPPTKQNYDGKIQVYMCAVYSLFYYCTMFYWQ